MTFNHFLIYGHRGWIGSQVIEILHKKNIPFILGKARLGNDEQVEEEINKHNPSHIYCCTGRTHGTFKGTKYNTIDYLEFNEQLHENINDNLYGPLQLALLCYSKNIHLTYIGTGCIFEYTNKKNVFTEDDKPNFFGSNYSVVKGFTDRLMSKISNDVLNLRIRMPITSKPNQRNFIDKIIKYNNICSIPNSMSVLDDLLPISIDMAMKGETGTYNFTNPGKIEHNKILELYKKEIDNTHEWNCISQDELTNFVKGKRSNNTLDTTKLQRMYPELKSINESVIDVINKRKKYTK